MAVFNPTKTRTWTKNTPADGDLIDDEVDRLYGNDQYLKDRIDLTDINLSAAQVPLGGIIEDNLNQASSTLFKDANAQAISRSAFSNLWNLVYRNVSGIVPATDRINSTAHGCVEGQLVKFSFTGGGITALTNYYIRNPTANDFQISATPTGTVIDLTSSQTGEMITNVEYGFGDGSTTYNVPDRRGIFARGAGIHGSRAKAAGGNYDGGAVGYAGQDMMFGHGHELWGEIGSASGAGTVHFNTNSANITRLFTGGGPTGQPVRTPNSDGTNGTPRTGNETTPAYVAVKYKVRVA
ncbi:hypothetical protein [Leptospira alstonii]|uniref:Tail fiber protein n=2 Tax=Leptospira alstonii TaxID=28452 RepID=M6CH79_9LEPT|nr:hypothetical protein [Leptospira alstonii]EMJ91252.1 hypothetical protein LEP1GSC194_1019 [Leptospira alstonii serovar Sichuan str. 79601]EQA79233.1 hypothetical protein LEP1GSC193_2771 [Leptospira alstonii serovar Pingchang str. 80-412]